MSFPKVTGSVERSPATGWQILRDRAVTFRCGRSDQDRASRRVRLRAGIESRSPHISRKGQTQAAQGDGRDDFCGHCRRENRRGAVDVADHLGPVRCAGRTCITVARGNRKPCLRHLCGHFRSRQIMQQYAAQKSKRAADRDKAKKPEHPSQIGQTHASVDWLRLRWQSQNHEVAGTGGSACAKFCQGAGAVAGDRTWPCKTRAGCCRGTDQAIRRLHLRLASNRACRLAAVAVECNRVTNNEKPEYARYDQTQGFTRSAAAPPGACRM